MERSSSHSPVSSLVVEVNIAVIGGALIHGNICGTKSVSGMFRNVGEKVCQEEKKNYYEMLAELLLKLDECKPIYLLFTHTKKFNYLTF